MNRRKFLKSSSAAVGMAAVGVRAPSPEDVRKTEPTALKTSSAATADGIGRPLRSYSGSAAMEVAFPLGGIGTGSVSLGGRGELRDWEIFNRPAKRRTLPFTFAALWVKSEGGSPLLRVVEGPD